MEQTMSSIVAALENATSGLLYPSETDVPFDVFVWKNVKTELTSANLLELIGRDAGCEVEEATLDDFFADLTADRDENGADEEAEVLRFRKLRQTIEDCLSSIRIFRVGKIEVSIYLIGRSPDGELVGLKTMSVET